jgi:hypothetical protein
MVVLGPGGLVEPPGPSESPMAPVHAVNTENQTAPKPRSQPRGTCLALVMNTPQLLTNEACRRGVAPLGTYES